MVEVFRAKIRKIGTSAGILIPTEMIREANLSLGEEVDLALLPHKKDLSGFGIAKNFKIKFSRNKKTRDF